MGAGFLLYRAYISPLLIFQRRFIYLPESSHLYNPLFNSPGNTFIYTVQGSAENNFRWFRMQQVYKMFLLNAHIL